MLNPNLFKVKRNFLNHVPFTCRLYDQQLTEPIFSLQNLRGEKV